MNQKSLVPERQHNLLSCTEFAYNIPYASINKNISRSVVQHKQIQGTADVCSGIRKEIGNQLRVNKMNLYHRLQLCTKLYEHTTVTVTLTLILKHDNTNKTTTKQG